MPMLVLSGSERSYSYSALISENGGSLSPGSTTGIAAGAIVGLQLGEGEAAAALGKAGGELLVVVPEPPQAASATPATKSRASRPAQNDPVRHGRVMAPPPPRR